MAKVGRYCKAYSVDQFRMFSGWSEKSKTLDMKDGTADGEENRGQEGQPTSEFLFLQENYVVTGGVLMDEAIVFDDITSEWKAFCCETLKFRVPPHLETNKNE